MSRQILGIRVDNLSVAESLRKAESFVSGGGQHLIFTPNPEMLVKAQAEPYFKDVLNRGDLNLCDGFGLWLAVKVESRKSKVESPVVRNTGVDFMIQLVKLAEQKKYSIYLLGGGSEDVVEKTAENLLKTFPNLKIVGIDSGPMIEESEITNSVLWTETIAKINAAKPDILFVAFGMGKQEKWLVENLVKMPSVKIGMGVGGAFDYISGLVSRAPRLMQRIGLEWLYRLAKQPRRFGRIFNATIKFIYYICLRWGSKDEVK